MSESTARRPLKSRSRGWAQLLSRSLLKAGVKPNQVSAMSVVFGIGAAVSLLWPVLPPALAWFATACCIQLRLLCNLMDGMLAVEGGLKTPNGDLYNEFPDRLADVLILASIGYASGTSTTVVLGWLASCGSVMTASIRMQGASLTGMHDYQGPMAKPHRMALATGSCLLMSVLALLKSSLQPMPWIFAVMVAGIVITVVRRLRTLSRALHGRAANSDSSS